MCNISQFSLSVMSNSLQPHGLQHTRLPCSSPSSGACSNSCTSIQWCHPNISSFVVPFSPCLKSILASGSFPMRVLCIRWPKYWNFSFSISPSNEYSGLIWSCSPRDSQESSPIPQFKSSTSLALSFFYVQLSHPYMTTGKTIALTTWTFVGKVISLLFNMLSRLVIAFLPRSKSLFISWLQSPSAVILEPPKIKSHCFHCFPIYLPWSDGTRCHDLRFLNGEL